MESRSRSKLRSGTDSQSRPGAEESPDFVRNVQRVVMQFTLGSPGVARASTASAAVVPWLLLFPGRRGRAGPLGHILGRARRTETARPPGNTKRRSRSVENCRCYIALRVVHTSSCVWLRRATPRAASRAAAGSVGIRAGPASAPPSLVVNDSSAASLPASETIKGHEIRARDTL